MTLRGAPVVLSLMLASAPALAEEPARARINSPMIHTTKPYPELFPSGAHVTFTSTEDGPVLQRRIEDDWVFVCRAPCDADVVPAATYHVDGRGLSTSREITFPSGSSQLSADPGSLALRIVGIVATSVGGAVMFEGTVFGLLNPCDPHRCDAKEQARDQTTGAVVVGAGAVALAVGLVMIASGRTTVSTEEDEQRVAGRRSVRWDAGGLSF